jgi:hypothetical protein
MYVSKYHCYQRQIQQWCIILLTFDIRRYLVYNYLLKISLAVNVLIVYYDTSLIRRILSHARF